jgi:hypothetical protein
VEFDEWSLRVPGDHGTGVDDATIGCCRTLPGRRVSSFSSMNRARSTLKAWGGISGDGERAARPCRTPKVREWRAPPQGALRKDRPVQPGWQQRSPVHARERDGSLRLGHSPGFRIDADPRA